MLTGNFHAPGHYIGYIATYLWLTVEACAYHSYISVVAIVAIKLLHGL